MAVTITLDLTTVDACEAVGSWTTDGTWSLDTYSGWQREGSYCLGGQVSEEASHAWYPVSSVDLTGRRVYAWLMPPGSVATKANGGLRIVLGDGTNRRAYYVGGSDDLGFQVGIWNCVVLDCSNLPSNYYQLLGTGAPSITAITEIGIGFNNPGKAAGNSPNSFFDIVRHGKGLKITGGSSSDPGKFSEIADDDASTDSGKAYGIIRKIQTGVYGVQGDIIWGDDSGTAGFYFKDEDAIVVIEDHVHGTGTPTDIQLKVVGNPTATTQHFELGIAIGSGDTQSGRNGVTFRNANIDSQTVIFDASDADLDDLLLYGCSFIGIKKGTTQGPKFSSDATNGPTHKLSGVSFDRCSQVDIGRVVTRNCIFSGYTPDTDGALLWNSNIDIKNSKFIGNTDPTNDPHAIEHPATGTFTYDNLTFSGNDYDINNSSGGDITINCVNGSNPSTYENTAGGSTTISNTVYLTVNVEDGDGVPIHNAAVAIYKSADDTQLMNKLTDANGQAQETYNYTADTDIYVRVRKSSPGSTRYVPYDTTGTITSDGFLLTVVMIEDLVAA